MKGINDVLRPTNYHSDVPIQGIICCPICSCENVHFDEYESRRAQDPRLWFRGDCGHTFALTIKTHKGRTYILIGKRDVSYKFNHEEGFL